MKYKESKKDLLYPLRKKAKKNSKKRKVDKSNSSYVESSHEYSVDYKPLARKFYILHGKGNHMPDDCNKIKAIINNHRKIIKRYKA